MSRSLKLTLDILIGAVVPLLILNNGTGLLGATGAYLLAALVPVAWVVYDLFFLTRRFNIITTYTGAQAALGGALAFWFVDGLLYALKDSAGLVFTVLVFSISLLVGHPLLRFFFVQSLDPDTPERSALLHKLLHEPPVRRALVFGTAIVVAVSLGLAVGNFLLNLNIVVAPFGTAAFNEQVARVNAITRIAFLLPNILALVAAIWLTYRAVYALLPAEEGKPKLESDIWHLIELREGARVSPEG